MTADATAPAARAGYRHALASAGFRALAASQLVSVTGNSIAAVGLTVLVYRRTASPLLAALTFSVGFLPYLVGGVALSSVVDRVRPRRLVNGCDAAAALAAAAMALPGLPVAALLSLLFLIGMLSSLASGCRAALVRHSVPDDVYVPARSLLRIAAQTAQIGGNAAAGALLIVISPRGEFLLDAATFAFSALVVRAAVAERDHTDPDRAPVAGSLRGARSILSPRPLRRLLLLGWLVPMFSVAPEAVAAPYVAAHHAGPDVVGWWLTALPVGLIAGDVIGVRFLSPDRQRRIVGPAAAASLVPYLAFFAGPPIPVAVALLVAAGAGSLYGLGLDARIRDAAPVPVFARTMAINSAGLMTLQGLGFTLAGAVAQVAGPGVAIGAAGAGGLVAVAALARPAR